MKNVLLIFSAAAMVLAACSKNEVVPATVAENVEISYNVAPRTKADAETYDAFSTSNVFASWAYYLPEGSTWAKNRKDAIPYFANSLISYNGKVWKNAEKSYYWPKTGSLTFFAYSLNSDNMSLVNDKAQSGFYLEDDDKAYGVTGVIDLVENPNTDLLVADVAMDKTGNTKIYDYDGVPTLFKHKLSKVIFTVKKAANYTDKSFTLKSIKFNNICRSTHYSQFTLNDEGNFAEYCKEGTNRTTLVYTDKEMNVETTDYVAVPDANVTNYIYVPQDFISVTEEGKIANIEVNYTVTMTMPGGKTVTEDCTAKVNLKKYFEKWEMGKRYTINLTFGLDEILWAPAVEDWTDGESAGIDIKA